MGDVCGTRMTTTMGQGLDLDMKLVTQSHITFVIKSNQFFLSRINCSVDHTSEKQKQFVPPGTNCLSDKIFLNTMHAGQALSDGQTESTRSTKILDLLVVMEY